MSNPHPHPVTAPPPAPSEQDLLPPKVDVDVHAPLLTYWRQRERQHLRDVYAGVRIKKFPEDLRVFEHVLWLSRTDVVVELGTHLGGSALWFRDRLRTQAAYGRTSVPVQVISVDLAQERAAAILAEADPDYAREITLVEGDVGDPALAERVRAMIPPGARCLVVEDTLHEYPTTLAALDHFADLVPEGGFFVVEDGIVDDPELRPPGMPGGVVPAVRDWLAGPRGAAFRMRRDLERYGLTSHPYGWLQRVAAA
ncbi:CmcI family methyltransferase [Allostreptomyces psammosilenae]|uniref:Cephalosporin hydroxylase n=1 Tax=Allostreptomyces psammosilenae TaxID=1892865 RepID=A0A852ZSF5_9ACTN|nr:CmcI family methyltransferase [Allostreptomyces psammosilenae]NYI04755.1 cephalosporin hydroxylase [Allostreptomyces psammosilenae]